MLLSTVGLQGLGVLDCREGLQRFQGFGFVAFSLTVEVQATVLLPEFSQTGRAPCMSPFFLSFFLS